MFVSGYFPAGLDEEQRENNIADTTRQPDGDKKEQADTNPLPQRNLVVYCYEDMKQRSPDAQEHMAEMREPGTGPKAGNQNADKSSGIDNIP